MQKLIELWQRVDKETAKLLIQWATELSTKSAKEVNEYLKSLMRRELNHAFDTKGESA